MEDLALTREVSIVEPTCILALLREETGEDHKPEVLVGDHMVGELLYIYAGTIV